MHGNSNRITTTTTTTTTATTTTTTTTTNNNNNAVLVITDINFIFIKTEKLFYWVGGLLRMKKDAVPLS